MINIFCRYLIYRIFPPPLISLTYISFQCFVLPSIDLLCTLMCLRVVNCVSLPCYICACWNLGLVLVACSAAILVYTGQAFLYDTLAFVSEYWALVRITVVLKVGCMYHCGSVRHICFWGWILSTFHDLVILSFARLIRKYLWLFVCFFFTYLYCTLRWFTLAKLFSLTIKNDCA